jgi:hypothetical protein
VESSWTFWNFEALCVTFLPTASELRPYGPFESVDAGKPGPILLLIAAPWHMSLRHRPAFWLWIKGVWRAEWCAFNLVKHMALLIC